MMVKRKKIMLVVVLSLLVLMGYYIHRQRQPHFSALDSAVLVNVSKVQQGDMAIEAHAVGTLVAANNVDITPEIAGQVAKVFFRDGGVFVKQGTPLIQLDDSAYRAKLESDQANLLYSETDYKRKALLGKQGAISRQAIDQALADLKTKEADAKQSQVNVAKMLLVAPFDGVLGKFRVSPGDYVAVGQKLVSLTDTQHLHAEYSVAENYLGDLHLGQTVKITTNAYPGKEFVGTIAFISPTINTEDRTIALYAEVPNEQRLLTSGMYVSVVHELGKKGNALLVPAASLVPTIDGQQIFKVVNNKVQAVAVEVGQRLANNVEIISGVAAGDAVVVAGQDKLKDGMLVQVHESV